MAWSNLPEVILAGQAGHIDHHEQVHAYMNRFQGGLDRSYYVKSSGGSDSNTGRSWEDAFATIARANQVTGGRRCRVFLGPGTHNVPNTLNWGDGARIFGMPKMTNERANFGDGDTNISNSGTNRDNYFTWGTIPQPAPDHENDYDMGVYNVHFDADNVNVAANYSDNANMGEVIGCYFTRPNIWAGTFQEKYLMYVSSTTVSPGRDMSWWRIRDNFTEHASLLKAESNGEWLNHTLVERNTCMALEGSGNDAPIPYVWLKGGWAGRNVVTMNNLEATRNQTYNHGAIHIHRAYQGYVAFNGMERIGGEEGSLAKGITLDQCTSHIVIHSPGQGLMTGYVYYSPNGTTWNQVPNGTWTVGNATYGASNFYLLAGNEALP
jgi:hypothetical protein